MVDRDNDDLSQVTEKPTSKKRKEDAVYPAVIKEIFRRHYTNGATEFEFERDEISSVASDLGLKLAKNPGDVIYAYRHRTRLPEAILKTQPAGLHWLILGAGDARYRFRLSTLCYIQPRPGLLVRKLPDATPKIIAQYALTDEQALLAKVRYNRLIDIFLGITAYSLQSHLRTKIPNYGQIEIDELYTGLDNNGSHFVVPVQAKGKRDKLGVIQTIQDITFCRGKDRYRNCLVRAVSAQFMADNTIALFELCFNGHDVSVVNERHYTLVGERDVTPDDLELYSASAGE